MIIDVLIDPTATRNECAVVSLQLPNATKTPALDLDVSSLLYKTNIEFSRAADFAFLAAVVYGIDKSVAREGDGNSEDRWTRELHVRLPVGEPATWRLAADDLATCISFLTGDRWSFEFRQADRFWVQPDNDREEQAFELDEAPQVVSLFSGGLDSFIGAVDWLNDNPDGQLRLAGHYDRHVAGPKSDQSALVKHLERAFPNRFDLVQWRAGLVEGGCETSFRSRSLLFIALATLLAAQTAPAGSILIPENGPIALNYPLIPSRRGACSTRTVHPRFLQDLAAVMQRVGLLHSLTNPYKFKTKGEMVTECRDSNILRAAFAETRSCAKAGRKMHWHDRQARGCGTCVPCLFRRAALHTVRLDTEAYGDDIFANGFRVEDFGPDLRTLLAFLSRNEDERQIRRVLMASGPLDLEDVVESAAVVLRMRGEVIDWLRSNAGSAIRNWAGIV